MVSGYKLYVTEIVNKIVMILTLMKYFVAKNKVCI